MPTDKYAEFVRGPVGGFIAPKVGLPQPTELERYKKGQPVVDGKAFIGAAPGGRLGESLVAALKSASVEFDYSEPGVAPDGTESDKSARYKVLVFDATGIADSTQLEELWRFFHPTIRRVKSCGRVVVLGTQPELTGSAREATAQRALEGFTRAVGKEIRKGSAVNLVYVAPGAEDQIESTLRFFISPRSAYVSGQVARVVASIGGAVEDIDWNMPLAGRVALVTGASRGIGASISATLARDGAHVIGLDIPPLKDDLEQLMSKLGGSSIVEDITAEEAPKVIADFLDTHHNGVDIVVHNAGVTKDKTLGRMDEDKWSVLMDINLSSEERINDELLARQLVRANGRVICVSSMSGIAGGAGQTNYSTSKAGVIGLVQSTAPEWAKHGVTINAVAPGFIETQMTAAMPLGPREVGRRMNSMQQGGLPIDVAEGIAWYASPASTGLTGNVVRVCGQMLIGA